MILDFSPLSVWDLVLFGVSFGLVWVSIAALLSWKQLRAVAEQPGVRYAGSVLIGIVTLLLFLALEDARLRIGLSAASFMVLLIGTFDENKKLSPVHQLVWQLVIAVIVVLWGWTIQYVSNWSGDGILALDTLAVGPVLLPGALLTVGWLLLLINSVNWLDGADGVAPGIGVIALLTLGAVSLLPSVQDEQTLRLSLIAAGGVLGLLVWNFPPARVYLGTSGSWYLGLLIGLLAIMSGGKIVTTLLVLALPVIDFGLVVGQRLLGRRAPWEGDTERHLHHRLLLAGLSPRTVVCVLMGFSAVLGWLAVVLQTQHKVLAFGLAAVVLVLLVVRLILQRPHSAPASGRSSAGQADENV